MTNRVDAHRARMRERGYKEVRYWVPDVSSPQFAKRIAAEAEVLNRADRRAHISEVLDELQRDVLVDE